MYKETQKGAEAQRIRLDAASTDKHENMRVDSKGRDAVEIILTWRTPDVKK